MPSLIYRLLAGHIAHSDAKKRHSVTGEDAKNVFSSAVPKPPAAVPEALRKKCRITDESFGNCRTLRFLPKNRETKPSAACLYLFGGGFMTSAKDLDYNLCADLALTSDAEVFLPFYPLEPKATIREIVETVLHVYEQMLCLYPAEHITFVGLSSGACICMYLLNYIRHEQLCLPFPARMLLNSPVIELPPHKDQMDRMRKLNSLDISLSADYLSEDGLIGCMLRHEPKENLYLSQILEADLSGWPELLLVFGTYEVPYAYLPDFLSVCRKYSVVTEVIEGKGLGHCYVLFKPAPEAVRLRKLLANKIR